MQCQSLGLEILGAVCAKSNKKKEKKKRNVFKSASTDFSGHWGKKNNDIIIRVDMVNVLANSFVFTHPADTYQHKHLYEVVFPAT